MTGFFRGPALTTHGLVVALICAVAIPFLRQQGVIAGWFIPLTGVGIVVAYALLALLWASRAVLFRGGTSRRVPKK